MNDKQPILICPLNWGLGHATRDIPIIRQYLAQQKRVIIAGYGASLTLLQQEFPACEFLPLPGFNVTYSSGKSQMLKMLLQLPSFFYWKWKEHRLLKEIVDRYSPSLIISDNRYGLWHPLVKTVLITHQLKLKLPVGWRFAERLIQRALKCWIEKFNECWIPDHQNEKSLAGELSHVVPMPKNAQYIGYLSRFQSLQSNRQSDDYVLVIASGPEPQRSMFVEMLKTQLSQFDRSCVLITGNPELNHGHSTIDQLTLMNHLPSSEMERMMMNAGVIICRSGYSTIMDLVRLKKKAILIPTPGQTEQEYLAAYLTGKHGFIASSQADFCFSEMIVM